MKIIKQLVIMLIVNALILTIFAIIQNALAPEVALDLALANVNGNEVTNIAQRAFYESSGFWNVISLIAFMGYNFVGFLTLFDAIEEHFTLSSEK